MSYYQKVLQDNPAGFWPLENGYITKDISAGNWQAGARIKNNLILSNSSATFYEDTFPLIMSGTNAYKFSSTNFIKINNIYNVFYGGAERKTFTIEFWISFDDIPTNEQVLTIKNDSTTVGYLIFNDNYASFTLWDSDNNAYTAKTVVPSYESQIYVTLSYLDRNVSLTINGINSGKARLPETSKFSNIISSPPYFQFGPRNNNQFVIDNIAFYTYLLEKNQMEARYAWAKNEKNTTIYTLKNKGGIIEPHENLGIFQDYILFNNKNTWSKGLKNNLVIENDILRTKFIPAAQPYNNKTNPQVSYLEKDSKIGLVTTEYNSLQITNFEDYFNLSAQAITTQIYSLGGESNLLQIDFGSPSTIYDAPPLDGGSPSTIYNTAPVNGGQIIETIISPSCYFSITGFNFGTLVLESTVDKRIRLYSFEDPSKIDLSYTPPASGWYDVKIYFIGNTVYMQINQEPAIFAAYSSNISMGNVTVNIGNCYADAATNYPTSLPIANFGIFDQNEIINNSSINISEKANLLFTLNATLSASQYGYWQTLINLNPYVDIVGSRCYYDTTSKNVLVEFSNDNITWYPLLKSGDQIPGLGLYQPGGSLYVRISMNTVDSENVRLAMSYLEIVTYSSLFSNSLGFGFNIDSVQNFKNTMIFRSNDNNMLARDNNFGIYFQPERSPSDKPGSTLLTMAENFSTIEFLFRIDDSNSGTYGYFIDSSDSVNYIRYNPSTMALTFGGFDTIYLNGFAISNGRIIQKGEMYHLVAVKNNTIDSSVTFKINSKYNDTFHCHATYGKLCLYPDAKNAQFARGKYLRTLGINKNSITDIFSGSIMDASAVYDEPDAILAV